ncbi:tetratricopeptide repeat-containing sulfotransferase family protein [Methylocaldum szegediense]|uniref:tetratricopeptide repeat-containing sulfotransferase family protein n=1 Tax=Methylocaldum szegediense TaxID=73780 RepID=UPI00047C0029|nr:sulfotransferase [Methylocaldum szegediense]
MMTFLQRGQAAVQSRNLVEAAGWFEKAVAENPKDGQAKACLGQTLCWLGRREQGIAHLRQSGQLLLKKARKSRDISLLLGLAEQLQFWNDYRGSLELLKQAVQIDGSKVRGFQLLALAHSRLNENKPALSAARKAVRLAPHSGVLQILLATLETDDRQYEEAKRRLEKVLTGFPTPEEKFRAHKELARVLDKLETYEQVFGHLRAAGDVAGLLPEVKKQDAALVPTLIKTNTLGFTRELLERWSCAGLPRDESRKLVFIVGFMRSGTTLTQEVLDSHPDVFVADETDLIVTLRNELHRMAGTAGTTPELLENIDIPGVTHLRRFYWERARGRFGEKIDRRPVFVDKTTMNTIDLGLINCLFPDAKVVFVMRDPRDVCLSCFMQTMAPTPSTVHVLQWERTAAFYAEVMEWWMCIRSRMTMDFYELRYEDAVFRFEESFRKVFDFVGLDWDPSVAEFHKRAAGKYVNSPSHGQVAQPLYTSSVGRWKHYEAEFAPISKMLEPFVTAFGYER